MTGVESNIEFGGLFMRRISSLSLLMIGSLIAVLLAYLFGVFEPLELLTYDARMRFTRPDSGSLPLAVVLVDDRSLAELGQWPWPRSLHAELIRRLARDGAEVIGFDMIFPERDSKSADGDALFARALGEAGCVICALSFGEKRIQGGAHVLEGESPQLPVVRIAEAARALGHVLAIPDADGVLRRLPVAVRSQGKLYFLLAVEAARIYQAVAPDAARLFPGRELRLGGLRVPLDGTSSMLVNYRAAGKEAIERFSYCDVIGGRVPVGSFRGKVVLIGFDATGMRDSYSTPLSLHGEPTPGVMVNALAFATLLSRRYISRTGPLFAMFVMFCASVAGAVGFGFISVRRLRAIPLAALPAGIVVFMLASAWVVFRGLGIWIDIIGPLSAFILSYLVHLGAALIRENRMRGKVRSVFERYVAPEVVHELLGASDVAPVDVTLGGVRRDVTVLFADIRRFTEFAEKHPPEEVVATLNCYLGRMTEAVFEESGTLDKFLGDGVMAVFGAPLPQRDAAVRAFCAAMKILKSTGGLPYKLGIGVGIASGEAVVGSIGSPRRMDYTAVGDVVNRANRLSELAAAGDVILDEATYMTLLGGGEIRGSTSVRFCTDVLDYEKEPIRVKDLGYISLRGVTEPQRVFAVSVVPTRESQ